MGILSKVNIESKRQFSENNNSSKRRHNLSLSTLSSRKSDNIFRKSGGANQGRLDSAENTEVLLNPEVSNTFFSNSGFPMPKSDRSFFESRFGRDFSNVKIHNDNNAANTAQHLQAKAFTNGNSIFFNKGYYNPSTKEGKRLIAHELSHVIQQSRRINRNLIQREALPDRDGNLSYDSRREAQTRLNNLIRVVQIENTSTFRIEWRWDTKNPSRDPWRQGTRIYDSREAAEKRKSQLMYIEEFSTADGTKWRVMKDSSLNSETSTGERQQPETRREESETPDASSGGTIKLTFDDGPNAGTPVVLDKISPDKGTFFLIGSQVTETSLPIVKRIISEDHAIGNHSYSHSVATRAQYRSTPASEIIEDFRRNAAKLSEMYYNKYNVNFPGFNFFRLPGDGRFQTTLVQTMVTELKSPHYGWDVEFAPNKTFGHVNMENWQGIGGVACTQSALPRDGNIILFHDRHWADKGAKLEKVFVKLRQKGFSFQKLS